MSKFVKILSVFSITVLLSSAFTYSVIATVSSNSNSNSNVNGSGGTTTPFTPSTTIKNWHEVK